MLFVFRGFSEASWAVNHFVDPQVVRGAALF